jgi:hypothetical protein
VIKHRKVAGEQKGGNIADTMIAIWTLALLQ